MLKNQHIICISMTFWDALWLSNHQYMKLLSRENRVLFVERPVTLFSYLSPNLKPFVTKQLRQWLNGGVRQVEPNLYVASPPPVLPLRFEQPVNTINQIVRRTWTHRIAKKLGFEKPILWIYDPDAAGVIGHLDEKLALYAVTDDHPSMMAQKHNSIVSMRAREQELVTAANLVVTTAENLRATRLKDNPHTYYIPHGIDADLFAQAMDPNCPPMPEMAHLPKPIIGFVGQLNQRINIEIIAAMASRHPDWSLVFIGPVEQGRVDTSTLESLPNVHFLGKKPPQDVPRYLKSMDVCLIPYIVDEHTTYMHPLKALEYLAAGKPVVSTPLPALSIYRDYITIAADTESFIASVEQALASDSAQAQTRRSAYAQTQTWENRLERISELIEQQLSVN